MRVTDHGALITTALPDHMVFRSSVAISGFSATMCSTRFSGAINVLPGAALRGLSRSGTKRPPGPVVRLMTTSVPLLRMRSMTSR